MKTQSRIWKYYVISQSHTMRPLQPYSLFSELSHVFAGEGRQSLLFLFLTVPPAFVSVERLFLGSDAAAGRRFKSAWTAGDDRFSRWMVTLSWRFEQELSAEDELFRFCEMSVTALPLHSSSSDTSRWRTTTLGWRFKQEPTREVQSSLTRGFTPVKVPSFATFSWRSIFPVPSFASRSRSSPLCALGLPLLLDTLASSLSRTPIGSFSLLAPSSSSAVAFACFEQVFCLILVKTWVDVAGSASQCEVTSGWQLFSCSWAPVTANWVSFSDMEPITGSMGDRVRLSRRWLDFCGDISEAVVFAEIWSDPGWWVRPEGGRDREERMLSPVVGGMDTTNKKRRGEGKEGERNIKC